MKGILLEQVCDFLSIVVSCSSFSDDSVSVSLTIVGEGDVTQEGSWLLLFEVTTTVLVVVELYEANPKPRSSPVTKVRERTRHERRAEICFDDD